MSFHASRRVIPLLHSHPFDASRGGICNASRRGSPSFPLVHICCDASRFNNPRGSPLPLIHTVSTTAGGGSFPLVPVHFDASRRVSPSAPRSHLFRRQQMRDPSHLHPLQCQQVQRQLEGITPSPSFMPFQQRQEGSPSFPYISTPAGGAPSSPSFTSIATPAGGDPSSSIYILYI